VDTLVEKSKPEPILLIESIAKHCRTCWWVSCRS
jgi:hypothetical protein